MSSGPLFIINYINEIINVPPTRQTWNRKFSVKIITSNSHNILAKCNNNNNNISHKVYHTKRMKQRGDSIICLQELVLEH